MILRRFSYSRTLLVAFLFSITTTPAPAQTGLPQYLRCDIGAGGPVSLVVSGDFDRNGSPDLAVADAAVGQVRILLVDSGRFIVGDCNGATNSATVNIGALANGLAAGDLDANDTIDVVAATVSGVVILRNNGSGTFTPDSTPLAAGVDPRAVAIADVDGDGRADIVVGNGNSNRVTFLFGKDRGFEDAIEKDTDGPATALVVTDFNNDSFLDVAAISNGTGRLTLLLQKTGAARRSFRALGGINVGTAPTAVGAADFNSNGLRDLVVPSGGGAGVLRLFVNQPPGTQLHCVGGSMAGAVCDDNATCTGGVCPAPFINGMNTLPLRALLQPRAVAIEDLNRDSKPDVVVASQGDSTVAFFLNDGQDGLTEATAPCTGDVADRRCLVGAGPRALVLADVDGDGRDDVVTANQDAGSISVLLSSHPGPTPLSTATPSSTTTLTPTATQTPITDCCVAHETAGCSNLACQNCVGANDPPCVEVAWDGRCVDGAKGSQCASACQCPLPTATATWTISATPTTPPPTETPTGSPTSTNLPTATPTGSLIPTETPTDTPLPTRTLRPSQTPTGSLPPTDTPTPTPTLTFTASRTRTATDTPGPTLSPTSRCFAAGVCIQGNSCAIAGADDGGSRSAVWFVLPLIVWGIARRRAVRE